MFISTSHINTGKPRVLLLCSSIMLRCGRGMHNNYIKEQLNKKTNLHYTYICVGDQAKIVSNKNTN